MGNDNIMENENYKHLGVNTNKYLSHKINIKDATDRLKGPQGVWGSGENGYLFSGI